MSCGIGHLYHSKTFGFDYWLIEDPAFMPDDGNPLFYLEEVPFLKNMDQEEMNKLREVKLAFPGSKVRDHILRRMPPLPFSIQYTQEEVDEIVKVWPTKYPKGAGRAYTDEEVKAAGYNNNAKFGLVIEDTIERFLNLTSLKWMRTNTRPGSDKVDFIVEGWRVDGKGRIERRGWRGNDYRLKIPCFQVYDLDRDGKPKSPPSPINAYWWGWFNPETLRCELYGWRPRDDYRLIEEGGLAIFRKAGTQIGRDTFLFQDNNDLGADEMLSEELFFERKGPK